MVRWKDPSPLTISLVVLVPEVEVVICLLWCIAWSTEPVGGPDESPGICPAELLRIQHDETYDMDLKDKVVAVAGASGDLGGELARLLGDRDVRLVLAGRDRSRLEETARRVGGDTVLVEFDIRSPESAATPIQVAGDRFGRVDGVINATGVVAFGTVDSYPEEIIDDLISTNLLGPLHMMAAAARQMDTGFFVNITGVVAEQPVMKMSPYLAAKTGLSAATRALAMELKRQGLLVVDARPPHTETGLASRAIHGSPPRFGKGLDPGLVAKIIIDAIESDETEVPSDRFSSPVLSAEN